MPRIRPTLRCALEDLKIAIPGLDTPLDEVDHPLLTKANEQFSDSARHQEKITAIDDEYLVKVKAQRWRGAVWQEPGLGWLIAAGWRESGSPDDFYKALHAQAVAARKSYNASQARALKSKTFVAGWLPNDDDRQRYLAEEAIRFERLLQATVHDMLCRSLRDGREHRAQPGLFALGVQVRADAGNETWVAIRIGTRRLDQHRPGHDPRLCRVPLAISPRHA